MMEERILSCLKKVKGEHFSVTKDLISAGYLGSFDILFLVKELEIEFKIQIPIFDITPNSFNSINNIKVLIDKIIQEDSI